MSWRDGRCCAVARLYLRVRQGRGGGRRAWRDRTERARLVEQVRAATATTQLALHSHALHGLLQQTPASTLRARAAGNVPHRFSLLQHCLLANSFINLKNISSHNNIITFYNPKNSQTLKSNSYSVIHKKGDKSNPNDYRPISLIPVISKVVEIRLQNCICQ